MSAPDITARNAALIAAFNGFASILRDDLTVALINDATADGLSVELERQVGHSSCRDSERETIAFTWDELVGADEAVIDLSTLATERFAAAQIDSLMAERARYAESRAKEAAERKRAKARSKGKRERDERAKLVKLMARYPDVVNTKLFGNMPTTAP